MAEITQKMQKFYNREAKRLGISLFSAIKLHKAYEKAKQEKRIFRAEIKDRKVIIWK